MITYFTVGFLIGGVFVYSVCLYYGYYIRKKETEFFLPKGIPPDIDFPVEFETCPKCKSTELTCKLGVSMTCRDCGHVWD